jgi:uncharacterized RDD family membrane protein YckC
MGHPYSWDMADSEPAPTYWTIPPVVAWVPPPTVRFAGVAWRGIAFLVDLVFFATYWWVLFTTPVGPALNGPLLAALLVGGPVLYFTLGWGRFGTTVGMRILRLRVVRAFDGGPIGFKTAAVRAIALMVLLVTCVAIVGFGLIALPIVLDPRRRGIHDQVAGTLVLRPANRWESA